MQYLSFYASDLHQLWNRDFMKPKGHITFMIKDTSTSQEPPASSKTPAMSLIFVNVLNALKLNRFQWNFKHSFLSAYIDNSNYNQGHQPQSGMSLILIDSNNNCKYVIDLWGWSWYWTKLNQIINITSWEHMETNSNVTKDTSPSKEHP